MNNTESHYHQRELCRQRDQEFLALYQPTLELLQAQGLPTGKAQRAAVEFTIAHGHPHYHVDHERAYRIVCHLLNAGQKKGNGARTYRTSEEMGLAKNRLRQQMWFEIAQQVLKLQAQGMSVEQALDHVLVHCRASRFYISPATALTKICPQVHKRTYSY